MHFDLILFVSHISWAGYVGKVLLSLMVFPTGLRTSL